MEKVRKKYISCEELECLHRLAKRKNPNGKFINEKTNWALLGLDGVKCLICNKIIGFGDENIIKHGLNHLREHNLLVLT